MIEWFKNALKEFWGEVTYRVEIEQFTTAAIMLVGTCALGLIAVAVALWLVLHYLGDTVYFALLFVGLVAYVRYAMKRYHEKFIADKSDNETGVE